MTMYNNIPNVLCPIVLVLCQIVRRAEEKVVRACVSMRVMLVFLLFGFLEYVSSGVE